VGQKRRKIRKIFGKLPQVNMSRRSDWKRRENQAKRFARLLKLLELLQQRRAYDAKAIAVELGTEVRTVYRDLRVL
jgi:hypothetical protein